jgi:hypothetical protein
MVFKAFAKCSIINPKEKENLLKFEWDSVYGCATCFICLSGVKLLEAQQAWRLAGLLVR